MDRSDPSDPVGAALYVARLPQLKTLLHIQPDLFSAKLAIPGASVHMSDK